MTPSSILVRRLKRRNVRASREHGYASQQPEFVLRRPKVIVSE